MLIDKAVKFYEGINHAIEVFNKTIDGGNANVYFIISDHLNIHLIDNVYPEGAKDLLNNIALKLFLKKIYPFIVGNDMYVYESDQVDNSLMKLRQSNYIYIPDEIDNKIYVYQKQ